MLRFYGLHLLVSGFVVAASTGCVSPEPTPANFAVRRMDYAGRGDVMEIAERVLVDLGYGIERRDTAAGTLTTLPIDVSFREEQPRGPRLSSEGRLRKLAEVRVARGDVGANIFCKVLVQEQTTQAHRLFSQDYAGAESYKETAIDRDAATTNQQNTVWRTLRRDKTAERTIVDAIAERMDAGQGAVAPAGAPQKSP